MRILYSFLALTLAVSLAIPGISDASAVKPDQKADKVFTHAKVYTVNEKQPWAEAVAIKDGKITYVGDNAGAKE